MVAGTSSFVLLSRTYVQTRFIQAKNCAKILFLCTESNDLPATIVVELQKHSFELL